MAQHVQSLINELLDRIAWPTTNNAAHRAKCLLALNNVEKAISQRGSMQYLSVRTTLALANTLQKIAAPTNPQFDLLKSASLSDDGGPLSYLAIGEFDVQPLDTGYLVTRTNRPGGWTIAGDPSVLNAQSQPTLTIFFDDPNATGSTITYNLTYQRTVVDLVDDASHWSLLPEGYEKTLLLDGAELEIKRILRAPVSTAKLADFNKAIEQFYSVQRTTKPEAQTDEDIADSKGYERAAERA